MSIYSGLITKAEITAIHCWYSGDSRKEISVTSVDVELKYTVLKEITDNVLVIPNSKILSGSFKNFSLPDKMIVVPVTLDVGYDSDLETVEKITLEVANNLLKGRLLSFL